MLSFLLSTYYFLAACRPKSHFGKEWPNTSFQINYTSSTPKSQKYSQKNQKITKSLHLLHARKKHKPFYINGLSKKLLASKSLLALIAKINSLQNSILAKSEYTATIKYT